MGPKLRSGACGTFSFAVSGLQVFFVSDCLLKHVGSAQGHTDLGLLNRVVGFGESTMNSHKSEHGLRTTGAGVACACGDSSAGFCA